MDAHEAAQMHQNFSQQLLQDHIAACSLPEHNLISVCETYLLASPSELVIALTSHSVALPDLTSVFTVSLCMFSVD